MKTPLIDNKHIYYCQMILGDELTLVDEIDDLELIGIHHILRVKYLHNKGYLNKKEMYKYCNAFDEKTQQKVDKVYDNFLDKKHLNKIIKTIIEKSEKAKKSALYRVANDTSNDIANDVSNDTSNDVSNVNVNVNVKDNAKDNVFTLKKLLSYSELTMDYREMLRCKIESENRGISFESFKYGLEAKGYKYKNFWLAYLSWCKRDEGRTKKEEPKKVTRHV